MREELLESEPPLCRMRTRGENVELRFARRTMHVLERGLQRRQGERSEDLRGNPVARARIRELAQRLIDERTQPALRDSFSAGIDGRERFFGGRFVTERSPVFGMDDLESERAAPHLAETAQ